jgi:dihydrofolate synthase/folylpolyglutamate synthase
MTDSASRRTNAPLSEHVTRAITDQVADPSADSTAGAITDPIADQGANPVTGPAIEGDVWRYLDALALGPATPRKRTLERMRGLVDALGQPQRAFPSIHVTGTNGKGSTVAYAAALLTASGRRVGTYTSPHLHNITERVRIDGRPVTADRMADAVAHVVKAAPGGVDHSWFELVTAAAFVLLAEAGIDVAVIEVGALGQFDATNVIDADIAVITNIEIEHAERAGPTRAHIAAEKSGIVRPGATLVLGEPDPALDEAWTAARPGRILRIGDDYGSRHRSRTPAGTYVDLWTPWGTRHGVPIGAAGIYQCSNAATALAAVDAYFTAHQGAPVARPVIEATFAGTRVGGRWDVLGHEPTVILDGAHNPAGAAALASTVDEELADVRPRVLVVGVRGRRSPTGVLAALRPERFDHIVCTQPPAGDACPAADVAAALPGANALPASVHVVPEWTDAVSLARDLAGPTGAVLVTGSLYLVGAVHGELTVEDDQIA